MLIFNVPNMITMGRIALIPVVALLLALIPGSDLETDFNLSFWAMIFFSIAGFSDLADGYYARKYGQVSVMGKFFDPMADKLIHMTALVFLIPLGRIEVWLVVVLLSRELFINGLRSMAIGEGVVIEAATWGKRKTAWLNVGIGALIMHHKLFEGTFFEINPMAFGYFCLWVGLIFSVLSGVQYTVGFFNRMK